MTVKTDSSISVKAHLSFSALSDYTRCGKQFQLRRVLGLEGTSGYARAGGSAVHEATETYDRQLYSHMGK